VLKDRLFTITGRGRMRWAVIIVSLGLYVVACTQPGASVSLGHWPSGRASGLALLLFGWAPGLSVALPWLSNFLWLAGLVLLARRRLGWALACSAVGLLFASQILLPLEGPQASLLEAKWWWLGSQATLAAGCGLMWFLERHTKRVRVDPDFCDPVAVQRSD
jgi:hypothetical protein